MSDSIRVGGSAASFVAAGSLELAAHGHYLGQGQEGEPVRQVQEALKREGYTLEVDGKFGDETLKMVRRFQADRNLHVDGWVGPETLGELGFQFRTSVESGTARAARSEREHLTSKEAVSKGAELPAPAAKGAATIDVVESAADGAASAKDARRNERQAARRAELEKKFWKLFDVPRGGPNADALFDLLAEYARLNPPADQKASMAARIHKSVSDDRARVHALAYLRNESGALETHDYLFFGAQGWSGLTGLATAEETMKRAIYEVTPENRAEVNRRLWTYYPSEKGVSSVYRTGTIRNDAPDSGKLIDPPAGADPLADYIRGEFSGAEERWLLAVPHIPRGPNGEISPAHRLAFEASEADGRDILRKLEGLNREQYVSVEKAFAELAGKGLLPEANGKTLHDHAWKSMDADERAALPLIEQGLASSTGTAARYAALRLDYCFGMVNDDEAEMTRLLTTFVGDGKRKPTFAEIAKHSGRKTLGADLIDEVSSDDRALVKALVETGKSAETPEIMVHRLMGADDAEQVLKLLEGRSAAQIAELHAAAGRVGGEVVLRRHIAHAAGEKIDAKGELPSKALAYWDMGDPQRVLAGAELYVVRDGAPVLSPAAQLLYAMQGPFYDRMDAQAIIAAARHTPEGEKAQLAANFQALANRTLNTHSLRERLGDLSSEEKETTERAIAPRAVTSEAPKAKAVAERIAAEVVSELERGWGTGAFTMEAGTLRETVRAFNTDLKVIFEDLEARRVAGEKPELTAEDVAHINASIQRLGQRLGEFTEERAAVVGAMREAALAVAIGAAAVATGGAAGAAVLLKAAAVGAGVGITGALVVDSMDGMGTFGEVAVHDVLVPGFSGAVALVGAEYMGARLAAAVPALGRIAAADAASLGPWTRFGREAVKQAWTGGALGGAQAAAQSMSESDWGELGLWNKSCEVLASAAKGFGVGAASGVALTGGIYAMRGAAQIGRLARFMGGSRAAVVDGLTQDTAALWKAVGDTKNPIDHVDKVLARLPPRTVSAAATPQSERSLLDELARQAKSFSPKDPQASLDIASTLLALDRAGGSLDDAGMRVLYRALSAAAESHGRIAPTFAEFAAWAVDAGDEATRLLAAQFAAFGFDVESRAIAALVPLAKPAVAPLVPGQANRSLPPPPPPRSAPPAVPVNPDLPKIPPPPPAGAGQNPLPAPAVAPAPRGTPPPPPVRKPAVQQPAPSAPTEPTTGQAPAPQAPPVATPPAAPAPAGIPPDAATPVAAPAAAPSPATARPGPQAKPATEPASQGTTASPGPAATASARALAAEAAEASAAGKTLSEAVGALKQSGGAGVQGTADAQKLLAVLKRVDELGLVALRADVEAAVNEANGLLVKMAKRAPATFGRAMRADASGAEVLVEQWKALQREMAGLKLVSPKARAELDGALERIATKLEKAEAAAAKKAAAAGKPRQSIAEWSATVRQRSLELRAELPKRLREIRALAKKSPQEALKKYTELLEDFRGLWSTPGRRILASLRHPLDSAGRGVDLFRLRWYMWSWRGKARELEVLMAPQIAKLETADLGRLAQALRDAPPGVGDGLLSATKRAVKADGTLPKLRRLSGAGHAVVTLGVITKGPGIVLTGGVVGLTWLFWDDINKAWANAGGIPAYDYRGTVDDSEKFEETKSTQLTTPEALAEEIQKDPAVESAAELKEAAEEETFEVQKNQRIKMDDDDDDIGAIDME